MILSLLRPTRRFVLRVIVSLASVCGVTLRSVRRLLFSCVIMILIVKRVAAALPVWLFGRCWRFPLARSHRTLIPAFFLRVALPRPLFHVPHCAILLCRCSTTVFSHAQTVVVCPNCSTQLTTPTGGLARLTEGCSFRKKQE